MSINVGEAGKVFGYNTNFDLSANTSLGLKFIGPDSSEVVILSSRITAPSVDGVFDVNGVDTTYLANQYMQFTILATDFPVAGQWEVCGTYNDDNAIPPEIFNGEEKVFLVGKAC